MKNGKRRITAFVLLICTLLTAFPMAGLTAFAASDAMTEINSAFSVYEKADASLEDDGYIGVGVDLKFYHDSSVCEASPGYMTTGGTPIVIYVVNTSAERVGRDSDVDIISSMLERGYIVAVLDYKNSAKAVSPAIDWSTQFIRTRVSNGEFFANSSLPTGNYVDTIVAPAGYNVKLNDVFFELDKHGTDGTLERIVYVWNTDFRKYHSEKLVKWVRPDGERKVTQNDFSGNAPIWYDADGTVNESGAYTKVKFTKAEVITDCVRADGTPVDLNMYYHLVYPSNPENKVPIMTLFSSAGYLMTGSANEDRPQFNGFLFNGYAGAMFDYGWVPMGRDDHYGYFDGDSGSLGVTNDGLSYSVYTFNTAQIATAAMRYTRYLAFSEPDTYKLDTDKLGTFGISKASLATLLGSPKLREDLITSGTDSEIAVSVNQKINSFYQNGYYVGHHGETRYDNNITETYTVDNFTVDGGELQPWTVYGGKEISGAAQVVHSSCGAFMDSFEAGFSPMFVTMNLSDEGGSAYHGSQCVCMNICRSLDLPVLYYEAEANHTFAKGDDVIYGNDVYSAFFEFSDHYLKGTPIKPVYTNPTNGSVISASEPIKVKFIGGVSRTEISKITVKAGNGTAINGVWTSEYGDTEWTFTPSDFVGGTVYTLTVPAGFTGKNGSASDKVYTYTFTTLPEMSVVGSNGEDIVFSESGSVISFTAPEKTDVNSFSLRFNVENDAVNALKIYSASSESDISGELIGEIKVNGNGNYSFDVTEYAMAANVGETLFFRVETASSEQVKNIYFHDFAAKGDFAMPGNSYSEYEYTEIDGEDVIKITVKPNVGHYKSDDVFYETGTSLMNQKFLSGGNTVTQADHNRKFIIKFRVYDTVSRAIKLEISGLSNSETGIIDYDKSFGNYQTKANEWCEFELEYSPYDIKYGVLSASKNLFIKPCATGNTEAPIYIDSLTVSEVFTTVPASVSLIGTQNGDKPYKADSSESAFTVSGVGYDSFNSAVAALTDGGALILNRNYTLTDSDNAAVSAGNITFDLNGYTLTSENKNISVFCIALSRSDRTSFKIVNGNVILTHVPLIGYKKISDEGNGKMLDISVENVYITTSENSSLTNIISVPSAEGLAVKANFKFDSSVIDIKSSRLPEREVTVLSEGSDTLSNSYSFAGGRMVFDSMHEITVCSAHINADDAFSVLSSDSVTAPTAVFTYGTGYKTLVPDGSENGYTVYKAGVSEQQSEYGVIPEKYSNEIWYPFLIFRNNICIGMELTPQLAGERAKEALSTRSGGTVYILMRRNMACTVGIKLCGIDGKIVFDLNGCTLTGNGTILEGAIPSNYNGEYKSHIEVKNGTLIARKGPALTFEQPTSVPKNYSISFNNVTFAMSNGVTVVGKEEPQTPDNFISLGYTKTATGLVTANIELNDCVYDLTGSVKGSCAPTRKFNLFGNTPDNVKANITVNGGKIIADNPSLAYMTPLNTLGGKNNDTLLFGKNSSGEYVKLSMPAGQTSTLTLNTSEGKYGFYTLSESLDGRDIYSLSDSVVNTAYGEIPLANKDDAFVLFDGQKNFLGGYASWEDALAAVKSYLKASGNAGKTVYALMQKDSAVTAWTALTDIPGSVILDLGGNTFSSASAPTFYALSASWSRAEKTDITVKNGVISMSARQLIYYQNDKTTKDKAIDFTFSDIKFIASYHYGGFIHAAAKNATEFITESNVTFNNCEFDFETYPPASNFTVFNIAQADVDVNVKINGGKMSFASLTNITFKSVGSSTNSVTFGKGSGGKYTEAVFPEGYDVKTVSSKIKDISQLFNMYVYKNENGSNIYSVIDESLITPYGVIPFEQIPVDANPFILFDGEGNYISSAATWKIAVVTNANAYLNSNAGKTVYIVMRKDMSNTEDVYMSQINGCAAVDLGGYTLTSTKMLLGATNASWTKAYSDITLKNGELIVSKNLTQFTNTYASDRTYNMRFEDIKITAAADWSASFFFLSYKDNPTDVGGTTSALLSFTDCVIDVTNITNSATFIHVNYPSIIANIEMNGVEFVGDMSKITLFNKGSDDAVTYSKGENGYSVIYQNASFKPSHTALKLYDNIAVAFRIPKASLSGYTNPRMKIEIGGSSYFVDAEDSGEYYIFQSERISPALIGEAVSYRIFATKAGSEGAVGPEFKTSIKDYCYSVLANSNVSYKEKNLIADMLNYCASAQTYVYGITSGLVNEGLSNYPQYGTKTEPVIENTDAVHTGSGILGISISLNNGLRVRISDPSSLKLLIKDNTGVIATLTDFKPADDGNGGYFAYFNASSAAQLRKLYTFELVDASENVVSSVTNYSFETYAYGVDEKDTALSALVKAMMVYGDSAYKFVSGK